MTTDEYSKACCTLPPVVSEYTPKGEHVALMEGMDAYVVGPANAKRVVVFIYSISDYHPATKQSAIEATLKSNLHSKLNVYREFDGRHYSNKSI
ncbi:hypothetical protein BC828DRAFT_409747 [Blastocladiella britannica]|nr:hypothetical protein BC828DRAFT_409747 [Blastocladiella britannica]